MSTILCSAGLGERTKVECLSCALQSVHPPCGIDYTVLKAIYGNDHDRPDIHVTDITGCLKRAYFDKLDPHSEYAHARAAAFLGSSVHTALEDDEGDGLFISELHMEALGLVGTADVVYKNRVIDFKTARWLVPDKVPYGSHALQLNIYVAMLEELGWDITSAAVQYIDMSGPSKCRRHKIPMEPMRGGYGCPKCGQPDPKAHNGFYLVEIELIDPQEIRDLIAERLNSLGQAMENKVPPVGEPSWLCFYCAHADHCPEGIEQTGG